MVLCDRFNGGVNYLSVAWSEISRQLAAALVFVHSRDVRGGAI
jgi:hypothetical protein